MCILGSNLIGRPTDRPKTLGKPRGEWGVGGVRHASEGREAVGREEACVCLCVYECVRVYQSEKCSKMWQAMGVCACVCVYVSVCVCVCVLVVLYINILLSLLEGSAWPSAGGGEEGRRGGGGVHICAACCCYIILTSSAPASALHLKGQETELC